MAQHVIAKKQRIEYYKTLLLAMAQVNPDEAQKIANKLIEELYPSVEEYEKKKLSQMKKVLNEETKKEFMIKPLDGPTRRNYGRIIRRSARRQVDG